MESGCFTRSLQVLPTGLVHRANLKLRATLYRNGRDAAKNIRLSSRRDNLEKSYGSGARSKSYSACIMHRNGRDEADPARADVSPAPVDFLLQICVCSSIVVWLWDVVLFTNMRDNVRNKSKNIILFVFCTHRPLFSVRPITRI